MLNPALLPMDPEWDHLPRVALHLSDHSVAVLPRGAILHTNRGDVSIKLFPDECPRTIENFTTHAKNRYYDNVIFHRCIKGFMVQTGDPLGG
jgi:peptidylprolyl isomerase domain and WD repeat-containing protein 1